MGKQQCQQHTREDAVVALDITAASGDLDDG